LSDYGRISFRCAGCKKYGWRLLIDKHARVGITCMGCARVVISASRCAAMIQERSAELIGVDLSGESADESVAVEVS